MRSNAHLYIMPYNMLERVHLGSNPSTKVTSIQLLVWMSSISILYPVIGKPPSSLGMDQEMLISSVTLFSS